MKENLFRGKLKADNGEHKKGDWGFGDIVRIKDGDHTKTYIYGFGEVDPETVGQFTGLHDATPWGKLTTEEQVRFLLPENGGTRSKDDWKGRPIFEDDIVDVAYDINYVGVAAERIGMFKVVFYKGCFMKEGIQGKRGLFHFIGTDVCTVVGNIYDNPELLKGGSDND